MTVDEIRRDCDGTPIVVGSLVTYFDNPALTGEVVNVGEWDGDIDDDTGRGYSIAPYITVIWDGDDGSETRYPSTQIGGWSGGPDSELLPECECEELKVVASLTEAGGTPG